MAYTYGIGNIKKNNYEVYMRTHATAETIDGDNKLKGFLQDFSNRIDLDEDSDYSDVTAGNTIYDIDNTGAGAFTIIEMNHVSAPDGVSGEVVIFKFNTKDGHNYIIKDNAGVSKTLDAEGEWVMLISDGTGYDFYAWGNSDGLQTTEYTKIGACEEKPSIKTSAGQSVKINNGDDINISENLEVAFSSLEITEANHEFIKSLDMVDIIFYDPRNIDNSVIINNIQSESFLEITGNDLNKNVISIKLETGDVDDHLTLYSAT